MPIAAEHENSHSTKARLTLMTSNTIRRVCVYAMLAALVLYSDRRINAAETARPVDEVVGWATVEGGTTGGGGGPVVTVRDEDSLRSALKGDDPATIVIADSILLKEKIRVGSNKTVLGRSREVVLSGAGLHLSKVRNVILRNLTIRDSADDAINIEGGSHHVWVDHCDLSQCHDGLLDIKHGSDLVTVSWCRFHDHRKTCLLGHSDKPSALAEDRGKLRVTYHHNFFDGSGTRHPRVRVAETVHIFNNYYRDNEYGAASTDDAGLLVEGNFFENVPAPTHVKYGDSKDPGRLVERRNHFVRSGKPEATGSVKEVPYKYQLDEAEAVAGIVGRQAGVRE
jgi:pectate lyase